MGDDAEAVQLVAAMLEIALGDCFATTGKARTRRGCGLAVFGTVSVEAAAGTPHDDAPETR